MFCLLDGLTFTEITLSPRSILPATFLYVSRVLNLLKLRVHLPKKKKKVRSEVRLLEPFSNFCICYWKRLMYINNANVASLCSVIFLLLNPVLPLL